jgi:hypothetical protein
MNVSHQLGLATTTHRGSSLPPGFGRIAAKLSLLVEQVQAQSEQRVPSWSPSDPKTHIQARARGRESGGSLCPVPPRDPSTKAHAFLTSEVTQNRPTTTTRACRFSTRWPARSPQRPSEASQCYDLLVPFFAPDIAHGDGPCLARWLPLPSVERIAPFHLSLAANDMKKQ